jgi:hypothetical protein
MKMDKIRELLHMRPFRPFWVHLADGGRIPVEHEDFVALEPAGREMIVYLPDNSHHIVDVLLVTKLEVKRTNGAARSKKK